MSAVESQCQLSIERQGQALVKRESALASFEQSKWIFRMSGSSFHQPPPPPIGFSFEDTKTESSTPMNPAMTSPTSFPFSFSSPSVSALANTIQPTAQPAAFGGGSWEIDPPMGPAANMLPTSPTPLVRPPSPMFNNPMTSSRVDSRSIAVTEHQHRPRQDPRHSTSPRRRVVGSPHRTPSARSRSPPRRSGSRGTPVGGYHRRNERSSPRSEESRHREVKQLVAEIQEIIDEHSARAATVNKAAYSVLFFSEDVFVVNPNGNPYGDPVHLTDQKPRTLREALPIGTKVLLDGLILRKRFVDVVATAVWPEITQKPTKEMIKKTLSSREREKRLYDFEKDTKKRLERGESKCVKVPLNGLDEKDKASVSEVVNEDYGKIEVRIGKKSGLLVLFHKEDVFLKDGKRAVEHEFFRNKPLDQIVSVRQNVNLIARSICSSKNSILNPAKIPLQAAVVSLNPLKVPATAPHPIRYEGGLGSLTSSSRSYVYLDKSLSANLNRKLVAFVNMMKASFPGIDPACLEVESTNPLEMRATRRSSVSSVEVETFRQSKSEPREALLPNLEGTLAKVKELLSGTSGILEGIGGRWLCFFTQDHVLRLMRQQDLSLREHLPPETQVMVNADLIEPSNSIQYIATAVWLPKDFPDRDTARDAAEDPALKISPSLLQKYTDFNEISNGKSLGFNNSHQQEQGSSTSAHGNHPKYLEHRRGRVLKILDANFAVAQVDDDQLVLFDTCDFWINPTATIENVGKTFFDVLKEGDDLVINAALMGSERRIQYLASGAWLSKDSGSWSGPMLIPKENLLPEKINIFNQVLASAASILPPPSKKREKSTPSTSQAVKSSSRETSKRREGEHNYYSNPLRKVTIGQQCSVQVVFETPEGNHTKDFSICGILRLDSGQFAFFDVNNSLLYTTSIGFFTRANVIPLQSVDTVGEVTHLAVTVNHSGHHNFIIEETDEELLRTKIKESLMLLTRLTRILGSGHECFRRPGEVSSRLIQVDQLDEKPLENASFKGRLKTVISGKALVLVGEKNEAELVYMELEDINTPKAWNMANLIGFLNKPDNWLRYTPDATYLRLKDGRRIFVVKDKGVQLSDRFFRISQVSSANKEKLERFDATCKMLDTKDSSLLTPERFLSNYNSSNPLQKRKGVVKHILNENFGLIRGVENEQEELNLAENLVLFDVFDLMVTANESAAEAKKNVQQVLKEGDRVFFNACVIDAMSYIPSLATSVWLHPNLSFKPLTPSNLQMDKVKIYREVSKSCSERMLAEDLKAKKSQTTVSETTRVEASLTDDKFCGRVWHQKDSNFAIVRLTNGEKALVHKLRIWIKDRPKYGDWKVLGLRYFRLLHVFARKVDNFNSFQYQIIYCHAGIKREQDGTFRKNHSLEKWAESLWLQKKMDEELEKYRTMHGQ